MKEYRNTVTFCSACPESVIMDAGKKSETLYCRLKSRILKPDEGGYSSKIKIPDWCPLPDSKEEK